MKKIFVSIYDCVQGMRMAETIFNDYGAVIVAEDTILDYNLIEKIKSLGINKIKVYDIPDDNIIVNNSELFKAQYNENVDNVKQMLYEISTGKALDEKKVNEVSDSIIVRINENRDIVSCINQMRSADQYTYTHSINVSLICMLIGKWLKFDYYKIKDLVQAGLLHDIGKGKIRQEILNKPDKLTPEEYEEIKMHPTYGYRLAERIPGMNEEILNGILMHHEREDGSGYPLSLKGSQICEFAKIIAVADVYDAMTSNRIYRGKGTPFDVFEMMEKDSFGIFDHRIISVFLKNIASYYIGDHVRLNTGEIGEIVHINPSHVSQPIIRVNGRYIDLSMEKHVKIVELI